MSNNNNKNTRQSENNTIDDFEPQPWDSPPGSRRPSPVPREAHEEEDDGFVDGFRVSKPMPLPLVSVHRGNSPGSSERSSSVSSITDQNTDVGAPRRNVFKEKAGFLSSASSNRRQSTEQQAAQKQWKPPPGAVKMVSPPRPQAAASQQRKTFRQERQPHIQQTATEEETGNYWQSELDQLPTQNQQQHVRAPPSPQPHAQQREQPKKASEAETLTAGNVNNAENQWRSAAAKYAAPSQPGMPQPARKYSHSPSSFRGPPPQQQRKQKEEEKKDDEDNHTATTATVTTQLSDSPRQHARQVTPLKSENLEKLETDFFAGNREAPKEKIISPQEQRKMELEALRNGTLATSSHSGSGSEGAGFKSAAALHHVRHDSHKLKPQQERANDCSDQRTSFASIKERLKSPVDHQPSTKQQQSSPTLFHASDSPFHQSNSATKSEVGVSSFTRQKMKVASMSSGAKSEAGYGKSPRNQQQSQHSSPEVNAVLNRMKGGMYMESSFSSPKAAVGHSDRTAPNSAPAFMGVKLRKTPSALGLSGSESGEGDQSYTVAASADSQDEQQDSSHGRDTEHRNLSYRERREMELRALEEEEQPAAIVSPRQLSQAQKMAQQQEGVPSPKRMSYRERREQELARERQMQQQQGESQNTEDAPKRDVADLIRRRIAANKGKNGISPTNGDVPQQEATVGRDSLRATGGAFDDQVKPSMSGTSDEYRRGYDNAHTPRNDVYEQQQRVSPRHSQSLSRHSDSSPRHDQPPQILPPARPSATGGLSSLHAQLKQLQGLQDGEEEFSEKPAQQEPNQSQGPRSAPKRMQALVDGKSDDKNLAIAHSQSSEHHSSPSRTPKATYAMLNAFLHGRESITSDEQLTPAKGKEAEDARSPPGSPPKAGTSSAPMSGTALKDDPKYARYFTMLKIGMPMDVVKHAMVRDNLDPSVMDGDHSKPACTGIPLKDDPKFAKYFKMLKIGMPMEAVKHAMERDGLDSHVMDQDHNLPADPSAGKQEEGPKEKDSHRRARLHWKPLGEVRRNSLWAKIDEDPALDNIEIDEDEFAELFQAEIQPDEEQGKKGKRVNSPRKGAAVRVIDPKRANNGGIILARLKMSHDDMADVVDRIDENCMTAEQIENIIEYLPTKDERRALEAYMLEGGQDAAEKFEGLCECEKFMVSMMTVKHAKRKVRALLFKLQFESCLEALYHETGIVETSCDELSNSVRLRQLLGIVLTFGNRLNTAGKGKKKKAGAFTLDSLLKLNQAKAFDKKTTFLQYIVLIVQRNNELLLRFKDDLPTVFKADKVFWDQCISDLEEVENQLENVRRIALYQARQAAKFRRKQKKKHHHDQGGEDDEESLSDVSLSLEEEVEALRSTPIGLFTLSAIKKVSFLRDRVEGTKVKFQKLLEYFGEDERNLQPHELFAIIVKFCTDFEKSKEQVFEQEKRKKREERKRLNANSNGQTPNQPRNRKPPQHSPGMLKASSMQPNASRIIEDMKRSSAPVARDSGSSMATEPRQTTQPTRQQNPSMHNTGGQRTPSQDKSAPRMTSTPTLTPQQLMQAPSQEMPPPPPARSPNRAPSQRNTSAEQDHSRSVGYTTGQMPNQQPHSSPRRILPDAPPVHSQASSSPRPPQNFHVDDVIPRGMQDQGRLEIPEEKGWDSMDISASTDGHNSDASLRQHARTQQQQQQQQQRGRPVEHPTHSAPPAASVPSPPTRSPRNAPVMERQNSAPVATTSSAAAAEHNYARQASEPLESTKNNNNNSSSSLMRNKLRNKRLMERRQRAQGKQPPAG